MNINDFILAGKLLGSGGGGGGGGGSSDFSTATISLSDYSLENENYESTDMFPFDMQIPNISDDKINNKITLNSFDDVIVVPLYKGVLFFVEGAMDTSVAAVSGDIVMETVGELPIINEYTITGNGTFKLGWTK